MGTHSITRVKDEYGKVILSMYRQYDGYLTGHGQELADFVSVRELTCGIKEGLTANGMGCLAAQIVEYFKSKSGTGGIYLVPQGSEEQYEYTVYEKDGEIWMRILVDGDFYHDGRIVDFQAAFYKENADDEV